MNCALSPRGVHFLVNGKASRERGNSVRDNGDPKEEKTATNHAPAAPRDDSSVSGKNSAQANGGTRADAEGRTPKTNGGGHYHNSPSPAGPSTNGWYSGLKRSYSWSSPGEKFHRGTLSHTISATQNDGLQRSKATDADSKRQLSEEIEKLVEELGKHRISAAVSPAKTPLQNAELPAELVMMAEALTERFKQELLFRQEHHIGGEIRHGEIHQSRPLTPLSYARPMTLMSYCVNRPISPMSYCGGARPMTPMSYCGQPMSARPKTPISYSANLARKKKRPASAHAAGTRSAVARHSIFTEVNQWRQNFGKGHQNPHAGPKSAITAESLVMEENKWRQDFGIHHHMSMDTAASEIYHKMLAKRIRSKSPPHTHTHTHRLLTEDILSPSASPTCDIGIHRETCWRRPHAPGHQRVHSNRNKEKISGDDDGNNRRDKTLLRQGPYPNNTPIPATSSTTKIKRTRSKGAGAGACHQYNRRLQQESYSLHRPKRNEPPQENAAEQEEDAGNGDLQPSQENAPEQPEDAGYRDPQPPQQNASEQQEEDAGNGDPQSPEEAHDDKHQEDAGEGARAQSPKEAHGEREQEQQRISERTAGEDPIPEPPPGIHPGRPPDYLRKRQGPKKKPPTSGLRGRALRPVKEDVGEDFYYQQYMIRAPKRQCGGLVKVAPPVNLVKYPGIEKMIRRQQDIIASRVYTSYEIAPPPCPPLFKKDKV